jgi:hypothetical protein
MSKDLPPPINANETKSDNMGFMAKLSKSAGAATRLVALQTERTKLNTLTLPTAYRALGKDCLQQKRHLDCVPELTSQLRSVLAEIKQISEVTSGQDAPQSFTDKAKAAGKQVADFARQKQLGMKRDSLIANIGKEIYDKHLDAGGSIELVGPIASSIARIAQIDTEIGQQSQVGKGSFVTPKRMLVGVAAALVLISLYFVLARNSSDDAWSPPAPQASNRPVSPPQVDSTPRRGTLDADSRSSQATSMTKRPAKQQDAIDALTKMYATVLVDPTKPDQPVIKVVLKESSGITIRGTDLEALAELDTIEELDVQSKSITDITHLAGLKRLKVFHAPPLPPDQFEIIASLPSLETLSCTIRRPEQRRTTDPTVTAKDRRQADREFNEQDFVQQALESLSKSKTLRNLRVQPFYGVVHSTDNSFAPIPRFPNLRYLELGINVTDRHLASISELGSLEALVLHGTTDGTTGSGIKYLAKCKSLQTLVMRRINDDILDGVASVPSLTNFTYSHSLSGQKVSDSLLIRIKRENTNLQLLNGDNRKTQPWAKVVPTRTLQALNGRGWNSQIEVDSAGETQSREELVEKVRQGMSRQVVINILGQPDLAMPLGQGQAMLYNLSDTEAFFISIDKNGNVFSADRQERSE